MGKMVARRFMPEYLHTTGLWKDPYRRIGFKAPFLNQKAWQVSKEDFGSFERIPLERSLQTF
jgi:hypothetical protein